MTRLVVLLCLFVFVFMGCKKSSSPLSSHPAPNQQKREKVPKIDACALLTKEEVGKVQETTISDTKDSEHADGTFRSAQCFYSATGPNLSVSLVVTQADPDNPSAPSIHDYWETTFEHPGKNEEGEKGEREEEGKANPPKKIEGLGDEAVWIADRVGGALYVLRKDAIVRISVGGPNRADTKLDKSKALATLALSRLPQ